METRSVKNYYHPLTHGTDSLPVMNGVTGGPWGAGEGRSCQLLERQGEQANYSEQPI